MTADKADDASAAFASPPCFVHEVDPEYNRELLTLKKSRTEHSNRIKGLLVSQGVRLRVSPEFPQKLAEART